jgi:hypothetical protein
VKTYEFPESSAICAIKFEESRVVITYNSNIDKEYEFNCENITEFEEKVSNSLKTKESIGKLVHSYIKEDKLVANNK